MKFAKYPFLFCTGGTGYMILELLWRGWSHGTMFLAGGTCFLLLGKVNRMKTALFSKVLMGSAVITSVELIAGLLFNRDYSVWDYRKVPFSFLGQICLPYSLLWIPVGFGAMILYRCMDRKILSVL